MSPSILLSSNESTSTSIVGPIAPVTAVEDYSNVTTAALVLNDGSSFQGVSFGAEGKSISGEIVFQTGN